MHKFFIIFILLVAGQVCYCDDEDDSLLIAAFNVQIFGQSKIQKEDVVNVLLKVIFLI